MHLFDPIIYVNLNALYCPTHVRFDYWLQGEVEVNLKASQPLVKSTTSPTDNKLKINLKAYIPPTKPSLISPSDPSSSRPQPSSGRTDYRSTSARSSPLKSFRSDASSTPSSPTKSKPPRLDLSTLQSERSQDSERTPGSRKGSPSVAVVKIGERESPSPKDKDMKREAMIYVVRSQSDLGKDEVIVIEYMSVCVFARFLKEFFRISN